MSDRTKYYSLNECVQNDYLEPLIIYWSNESGTYWRDVLNNKGSNISYGSSVYFVFKTKNFKIWSFNGGDVDENCQFTAYEAPEGFEISTEPW